MPHHPPFRSIHRRNFIKGAGSFLALAATLGGAGCGDSQPDNIFSSSPNNNSGSQPTPAPGSFNVVGQINVAELGGGTLTVSTAQLGASPVAADGSFNSTTGGTIPQLLFIGSGDGSTMRGLALFVPGTTSVTVDAESTALALTFMVPGILELDPTRAPDVVRAIRALPGYGAFQGFLRQNLKLRSLADLVGDAEYQRLSSALCDEYDVVQTLNREVESAAALLTAELRPDETGIDLSNGAWRFTQLIRQEVDANGLDTVEPVKPVLTNTPRVLLDSDNLLGGVNAVSWGNIYTFQAGDPTGATDVFTPNRRTKKVIYWVVGPGCATDPGAVLPQSITLEAFTVLEPYAFSIFYYVFLPVLDLCSGGLAGLALHSALKNNQTFETLTTYFDLLLTAIGGATSIDTITDASRRGDEGNFQAGMADLAATIASTSVGFASTLAEGLIAAAETDAAAAAVLATAPVTIPVLAACLAIAAAVFTITGTGFAAVNLKRAVDSYGSVPFLTSVTVDLERDNDYSLEILDLSPYVAVDNVPGRLALGGIAVLSPNLPGNYGYTVVRSADGSLVEDALRSAQVVSVAGGNTNRLLARTNAEGMTNLYYFPDGTNVGFQIPLPAEANPAWGDGASQGPGDNGGVVNDNGLIVSVYGRNPVGPTFGVLDLRRSDEERQRRSDLYVFDSVTNTTRALRLPELLGEQIFDFQSLDMNLDGEIVGILRTPDLRRINFHYKPADPSIGRLARVEVITTAADMLLIRINDKGQVAYLLTRGEGGTTGDNYPLFLQGPDGSEKELTAPGGLTINLQSPAAIALSNQGTVVADVLERVGVSFEPRLAIWKPGEPAKVVPQSMDCALRDLDDVGRILASHFVSVPAGRSYYEMVLFTPAG